MATSNEDIIQPPKSAENTPQLTNPRVEVVDTSKDIPSESSKDEKSKSSKAYVKYSVEWRPRNGPTRTFDSDVPFHSLSVDPPQPKNQPKNDIIPGIEFVTLFHGKLKPRAKWKHSMSSGRSSSTSSDSDDYDSESVASDFGERILPNRGIVEDIRPRLLRRRSTDQKRRPKDDVAVTLEDLRIKEYTATILIIRSELLLDLLRGLVDYYPSQNLTGKMVTINQPFKILFHYWDELNKIASKPSIGDQMSTDKLEKEEETKVELRALIEALEPYYEQEIEPIRSMLARPIPAVKFLDLWYIFKPGADFYFGNAGNDTETREAGSVIDCVFGSSDTNRVIIERRESIVLPSKRSSRMHLQYWRFVSDGVRLQRDRTSYSIDRYDGEREVMSLPFIPSSAIDSKDNMQRRKHYEDRGKKVFEIIRGGHRQMRYDNQAIGPQRSYGIIMSDTIAYMQYKQQEMMEYSPSRPLSPPPPPSSPPPPPTPERLNLSSKFRWENYNDIFLDSNRTLTPHQYFLMDPYIFGFALKEKTWKSFHVDHLHELETSTPGLENLVIDEKKLEIIQAVSDPHNNSWHPDFIRGKGEGQIILLHGPPGVGKTYTVECIAESTGRPLLMLTIADIGKNEENVESELVKWFTMAENWGAILLIDEAEIFLEKRKGADLARNGLVSVFLRKMEYFRGILFLTTNRIGQIDDAFISRMHVVLRYSDLTEDQRKKIWKGFFKKLELDMAKLKEHNRKKQEDSTATVSRNTEPSLSYIEVDSYARQYVLNDKDVVDLQWNGREIRNAFQTAISLAGYSTLKETGKPGGLIVVEKDHFVRVVEMSQSFHNYMDSIPKKDASTRAIARGDRNDKYN